MRVVWVLGFALALFGGNALFANDRYSASVRQVLAASYAQKDQSAIVGSLTAGASKAGNPDDRKAILASLADFEERNGLFSAAAKHYNEIAFADPKARDDGAILDASRCSFESGDSASADGFVRAVLLTCFDEKILVRARVYAAWIQLSSGNTSSGDALSLIRAYSENASFDAYAAALLFTLWWADGDASARTKLLASYPGSPESAILRGEMQLAPSPFWYLMSRDGTAIAAFAREGSAALASVPSPSAQSPGGPTATQTAAPAMSPATPTGVSTAPVLAPAFSNPTSLASPDSPSSSQSPGIPSAAATPAAPTAASAENGGTWQQAGFFRNREYADDLRGRLSKLGFKAIVREEKRPSGTVYFSVLVPEDTRGSTAARLKDAGFESYLISD